MGSKSSVSQAVEMVREITACSIKNFLLHCEEMKGLNQNTLEARGQDITNLNASI
jgi:hypothetical protein